MIYLYFFMGIQDKLFHLKRLIEENFTCIPSIWKSVDVMFFFFLFIILTRLIDRAWGVIVHTAALGQRNINLEEVHPPSHWQYSSRLRDRQPLWQDRKKVLQRTEEKYMVPSSSPFFYERPGRMESFFPGKKKKSPLPKNCHYYHYLFFISFTPPLNTHKKVSRWETNTQWTRTEKKKMTLLYPHQTKCSIHSNTLFSLRRTSTRCTKSEHTSYISFPFLP